MLTYGFNRSPNCVNKSQQNRHCKGELIFPVLIILISNRSSYVGVEGQQTPNNESTPLPLIKLGEGPSPNNESNNILTTLAVPPTLTIPRRDRGLFESCHPPDREGSQCIQEQGVKCMLYADELEGRSSYSCGCDYFHTPYARADSTHGQPWNKFECLLNVFAPCYDYEIVLKCGPHMVCTPDTLRITNDRYCRCLPGYGSVDNALGIPAYCRRILAHEDEGFEDEEDFDESEEDTTNDSMPQQPPTAARISPIVAIALLRLLFEVVPT